MKTIIAIIAVFIFGLFGWMGVDKKNTAEEIKQIQEISNKDQFIKNREMYCADLKCDVKETQQEIDKQINQ